MSLTPFLIFFLTAAIALPGVIVIATLSFIYPQYGAPLKDRTIAALSIGLINFIFTFWLSYQLFDVSFVLSKPLEATLYAAICFIAVPLCFALIIVVLLEKTGFREKTSIKTAWDFKFSQIQRGSWIAAIMDDDHKRIIGGKFGQQSFLSSSPHAGHIYIEEMWHFDSDRGFYAPMANEPGLILRPDDYKYLLVYDNHQIYDKIASEMGG